MATCHVQRLRKACGDAPTAQHRQTDQGNRQVVIGAMVGKRQHRGERDQIPEREKQDLRSADSRVVSPKKPASARVTIQKIARSDCLEWPTSFHVWGTRDHFQYAASVRNILLIDVERVRAVGGKRNCGAMHQEVCDRDAEKGYEPDQKPPPFFGRYRRTEHRRRRAPDRPH